jgi:glutathione synthase/RimK-type ligase-like ATP-grasp enzyme
MKNKKVVVVYYGNDWKKAVPILSQDTRKSFEDWHVRGLGKGVEMYRASFAWFDLKTGTFKKSWAYRDGKWKKSGKPIKPDLIFDKITGKRDYRLFDKKMEISKKVKIFNSPLFRTILDNKLSQYLVLSEFMAPSYVASDEKETREAMKKIKSSKVVLKPIYGSGGFGILIEEKNKIKLEKIDYPIFVQEFIKSEKGIPGFSKKKEVADLRMVFMNHELVFSLSRIAKTGSLFTNFHQGAQAVIVPEKSIPKKAKIMADKIVEKLKIFPEAQYALDFIFTNSGNPILVEMNTTPGFDLLYVVGDEKIKEKNFEEFIKILK